VARKPEVKDDVGATGLLHEAPLALKGFCDVDSGTSLIATLVSRYVPCDTASIVCAMTCTRTYLVHLAKRALIVLLLVGLKDAA
jgi:hypothetical protein